MRLVPVLFLVVTFVFQLLGVAVGNEIETQTYSLGEWQGCGFHCRYMEIPVSISSSFSRGSIDSIWVTLEGVSDMGSITFSQGGQSVTYDCSDGLLISFEVGEEDYSCGYEGFSYDGVADYIAAFYAPSGDQEPFVETLPLHDMERTACCDMEFEVLNTSPDFGALFDSGTAILRIQQVSGGRLGPSNSCWRCNFGLAQLSRITINVAFTGSLPTDVIYWGAIKSKYRQ
jgi:hypothetical protein